jgi:hypothetical protein
VIHAGTPNSAAYPGDQNCLIDFHGLPKQELGTK